MKTSACHIHGLLTEAQCYLRKRGTRVDLECKECSRAGAIRRSKENRPKINARRSQRYINDSSFKKKRIEAESKRYELNPEKKILGVRAWRLRTKIEALTHYSGGMPKCARCLVTEIRFLALDHIDENGASHREKTYGHASSVSWAKQNDFPSIFQVLCHNCNIIKHHEYTGETESSEEWRKVKHETLSHYASGKPKCALCDIDDLRALTIDHVDGGGNEHRRKIKADKKSSSRFYRWLQKNKYPAGFRVLCFNHNLGEHCLG